MKVYLAGPMRGLPEFNFPAFFEAARRLRLGGLDVMSPAEHDVEEGFDYTKGTLDGFDLIAAFRWDIDQVLSVDAIVLLPGWEKSSGVAGELAVARAVGRDVYEYLPYDPENVWPFFTLRKLDANEQLRKIDEARGMGPLPPEGGWVPPVYLAKEYVVPGPEMPDHITETRVIDPDTGAAKGQKLAQLGAIDPDALWELAEVAGFGAEKYDRNNYLKGMRWSLMIDAAFRHLLLFASGADEDEESGMCHAAHAAWQCLALVSHYLHGLGTDDRPRPGKR